MSDLKDVFTTLENTQVEPLKKVINSINDFLNVNSSLICNSYLLEKGEDLPIRVRANNNVLNIILEGLVDYLEEYISYVRDSRERLEFNPNNEKVKNYLNPDEEVKECVYTYSGMFEFIHYMKDRL